MDPVVAGILGGITTFLFVAFVVVFELWERVKAKNEDLQAENTELRQELQEYHDELAKKVQSLDD